MLTDILQGSSIAVISGFVGFLISKKITSANFNIYIDQAKAKASVIESEAQLLLKKSTIKSQEIEIEATKHYESAKERAKADLHQREDDVIRKEQTFKRYKQNEEKKIHDDNTVLKAKKIDLDRNEKLVDSLKKKYELKIDEALHSMENCAGMTQTEAQAILLEKI